MKLCNYYVEIKDMSDGETKLFSCDCKRHKGREIQVVKIDGEWKEIALCRAEPIKSIGGE